MDPENLERSLLAIMAAIVYAGAANYKSTPGYSPSVAVEIALELMREVNRKFSAKPQDNPTQ
jgi:hypothetical protein